MKEKLTKWLPLALLFGVVAIVGVNFYNTRHSYFIFDDYFALMLIKESGSNLFAWLNMVIFQHYAPLNHLLLWIYSKLFFPNWEMFHVIVLAIYLGIICYMYVLCRLLGASKTSLILFSSGFSIYSYVYLTYMAAGFHHLPAVIFNLMSVYYFFKFDRDRKNHLLLLSVIFLVCGLGFYIKDIFIPVIVLVLAFAKDRKSFGTFLKRNIYQFGLLCAPVVIYLLACYKLFLSGQGVVSKPPVILLLQYYYNVFVKFFFLSLMNFSPSENFDNTREIALGVFCLFILLLIVRQRKALEVMLSFLALFLAMTGITAASRLGQVGMSTAFNLRYFFEIYFLFYIFLVLSLCSSPRVLATAWHNRLLKWSFVFSGMVCLGFALYNFYTTIDGIPFERRVAEFTRGYYETISSNFAKTCSQNSSPVFFDEVVSETVVPGWVAPYNRYSKYFTLFNCKPSYNMYAETMYTLDAKGDFKQTVFKMDKVLELDRLESVGLDISRTPEGQLVLRTVPGPSHIVSLLQDEFASDSSLYLEISYSVDTDLSVSLFTIDNEGDKHQFKFVKGDHVQYISLKPKKLAKIRFDFPDYMHAIIIKNIRLGHLEQLQ